MAGGVGTRFWPMSKTSQPKQFIDILGTGKTLIQQTFDRFLKVCPKENILIVTNEIYREKTLEQLEGISPNQVLCEPCMRNTAPCIAYATYKIHQQNPEARVVVAPSDHVILKEEAFTEIIHTALEAAGNNDWLLTLGIQPSRPDTGYGYIQFKAEDLETVDKRIKKVNQFTEKPQLEKAKAFLASGDYLWNAGIFIWSIQSIIEAFENYLPDVNKLFKNGLGIYNTQKEQDFINDIYPGCEKISIDYGVMEKAENVYVLASEFGWSDLGTWGSLYSIREKNEDANTIIGDNVLTYDTKNCIVNVPKEKLVVLQGLDDYIVVEEDSVLLVCRKEDEQMIRKFVDDVGTQKGKQFI